MPRRQFTRRSLLGTSAAGGALSLFSVSPKLAADEKLTPKVERLGVGAIGLRYQGSVIGHQAQMYGDIVSVCDVDKNIRDQAQAAFSSTPRSFEDYRELLARPDVDVVLIGKLEHVDVAASTGRHRLSGVD
jgi:myo-inositol 2-dehydrogenase/D-chiro-inositol 1-dehydrogenase